MSLKNIPVKFDSKCRQNQCSIKRIITIKLKLMLDTTNKLLKAFKKK